MLILGTATANIKSRLRVDVVEKHNHKKILAVFSYFFPRTSCEITGLLQSRHSAMSHSALLGVMKTDEESLVCRF